MNRLSLQEFEVLSSLVWNGSTPSKSAFAGIDSLDAEGVKTTLHARGLIDNTGGITSSGYDALEPYRVKRAILLAAGFGSRLMPVTYNTPKPLARVNGVRMIDLLLDAVETAGIKEVYVIRGYLGEQFDQLLAKYKNITFIENPMYDEANNISSLYVARDVLSGSYVIESDLLLSNSKIIMPYQYCSNYLGVPTDETDDWCFEVTNGYISKVMVGATDCHHMFGISYWTEQDGVKLGRDIADAFARDPQLYWDEVPLRYYKDDFNVRVRECTFDDIVEIDTLQELQEIDSKYKA